MLEEMLCNMNNTNIKTVQQHIAENKDICLDANKLCNKLYDNINYFILLERRNKTNDIKNLIIKDFNRCKTHFSFDENTIKTCYLDAISIKQQADISKELCKQLQDARDAISEMSTGCSTPNSSALYIQE